VSDYNVIGDGLTVEVRQVPDFSVEIDANGQKTIETLPGMLQVGVVLEGVFVPLLERKAAGLLADIAAAKAAAETPAAPAEPAPAA
jgi:hypothetical protein